MQGRRLLALTLMTCAVLVPLSVTAQQQNVVRVGYIATRSFFGATSLGGFQAELVIRAAAEFLSNMSPDDASALLPNRPMSNNTVAFELIYAEASPTELHPAAERCEDAAKDLVNAGVHVVVGPPTSSCSIPSAAVLGAAGIPQISHSATSVVLSDKDDYPTFFRIPSSDTNQGLALAKIIADCTWSRVGIISTKDEYAMGLTTVLEAELGERNIRSLVTFLDQGSPTEEVNEHVQVLKDYGSAINVIIALRDDVTNILDAALSLDMAGPGWTWLGADGLATQTGIEPTTLQAFAGMIGTTPLSFSGPLSAQFHSYSDSLGYSDYVQDAGVPNFAPRLFDALFAVFVAVRTESQWNTLSVAQKRSSIVSELRGINSSATSIPSASQPRFWFDAFQDGPAGYDVVNVQQDQFARVGSFIAGSLNIVRTIVWSDGTRQADFDSCPSDIPPAPPTTSAPPSSSGSGTEDWVIAVVVVVAILFLIVVVVLVFVLDRNRREENKPHDFEEELAEMEKTDSWKELVAPKEIKRRRVRKLEKLFSQGQFADVYKGRLQTAGFAKRLSESGASTIDVVIKETRRNALAPEHKALLAEAAILAQFSGHPNIVALLGVVTVGKSVQLIMENCSNGNLKDYLSQSKGRLELSLAAKLRMILDVLSGMCYISDCGAVHRDLAARNVLVADDVTCKIGDFGLSRFRRFYDRRDTLVAVKWAAPEVLSFGRFSTASDVWAFGVTVMEILMNGEDPYPNMSNDNVRVAVTAGSYVHKIVPQCPRQFYAIIKECWEHDPKDRPTFSELMNDVEDYRRTYAPDAEARHRDSLPSAARRSGSRSTQMRSRGPSDIAMADLGATRPSRITMNRIVEDGKDVPGELPHTPPTDFSVSLV